MDIVIDTQGQTDLSEECSSSDTTESDSESEDEYVSVGAENFSLPYRTSVEDKPKRLNTKDDELNFDDTYLDGDDIGEKAGSSTKFGSKRIDEILKKSVIQPGFESLDVLPEYDISKRKLAKLRRKDREKSKGKDWFNLPAPDMTDEKKHDLEVLQMRSVLDPKQFYKKNDLKVLPKYFQVGRIVETPADFYSSRIPKKQRKRTIVEELLADAEFKRYNKRKYKEIIEENKKKGHSRAHRHAKRLKKKNK